jgi:hypothetical protein
MRVAGLPQRRIGTGEPVLPRFEQELKAQGRIRAHQPANVGIVALRPVGQPFTDVSNDSDRGFAEHAHMIAIVILVT